MRTALALLLAGTSAAAAGDWPQVLGPDRNGVASGERPLTALPSDPDPLWTKPVGQGFAGPSVYEGAVLLFHRTTNDAGEPVERLEALDAATGKPKWISDGPSTYAGRITTDSGPRCVPVVTPLRGGRVVTFGAAGVLRCVSLAHGGELWARDLAEELDGDANYFGFGSTPLIVADGRGNGIVVCTLGAAREEAGVVALELKTGEIAWTAADAKAAYASPVLAEFGKRSVIVAPTRLTTYGLDPNNGNVLWKIPFGARGPTALGANPVLLPGPRGERDIRRRLFLTANYGVGATLLTISADDATVVYDDSEVLASHYATPVAVGDALYGIDGRQDVGSSDLVCFDPAANRRLWTKENFGHGTPIGLPGGRSGSVLILKTDGELVLIDANPEAYRERGRLKLFDTTTRALPAYSAGVLFARDTKMLKAVSLRPE